MSSACEHADTAVINSRPADFYKDGRRHYAATSYPCLIRRTRKCLRCGHRFPTVELPKDWIDGLVANQSSEEQVRDKVLADLRQLLAAGGKP